LIGDIPKPKFIINDVLIIGIGYVASVFFYDLIDEIEKILDEDSSSYLNRYPDRKGGWNEYEVL
jgi:hypothetical protein